MSETVTDSHIQALSDAVSRVNINYLHEDPSVSHNNINTNNQQQPQAEGVGIIYSPAANQQQNNNSQQQQQGESKQNINVYDTSTQQQPDGGENGIFKLFVGQIPPFTSEETLRNTFSPYGLLTDVVILKDRHTGAHKGCGFVCYNNKLSADSAISALGDRVKLPNAKREMIVRYAGDRPDEKEYKLYVCMLSRQSTEQDIRNMFEPFGHLNEVFIIRSREGNQSKGAAFVKFINKEDAQRAVEAIHDRVKDKDAPGLVQVRFAHTKEERAAHLSHVLGTQHALTAQQHHAAALRTPPAAYSPHLAAAHANFLPYHQGLHHLKQYHHPQAAIAKTADYSSSYDQQHYSPNPPYYSPPFTTTHLQPANLTQSISSTSKDPRGPEGANLFVYNVPESYTEVELNTLFSSFGSVLSTRIQRDLQTGVSKGFGFVSYEEPLAAQSAIQSLDGTMIGNKRLTVRVKTQNRQSNNYQPQQQQLQYQNIKQHHHLYQ